MVAETILTNGFRQPQIQKTFYLFINIILAIDTINTFSL